MATSLVQLANGSADTTQANPPDKEKARLELNLTGLCSSYAIQRSFLLSHISSDSDEVAHVVLSCAGDVVISDHCVDDNS